MNAIIHSDCLPWMAEQPDDSIDLVFGSPPYEAQRTYSIEFDLRGQDWVDWMVEVYTAAQRICRGLVAMVVEGSTTAYRYSATPMLLAADLHRAGFNLRKPPIYFRYGIPGSGGPDWVRNDYEFIVCVTKPGKLPWSDNSAMGGAPKYPVGGLMSNRHKDGRRKNESHRTSTRGEKNTLGSRPSHAKAARIIKVPNKNGQMELQGYIPPDSVNPGNVINCGAVGGGNMGSKTAHENEAPFPEALAEFFVRSFCAPGGIVYDPFCGSGTTAAVAKRCGRQYITTDVRQSQIDIARRRVAESSACQTELF